MHRKLIPWFFSFEEFFFFAKFVDRFGLIYPKFKFDRVNLRGGKRGHFKCQTVTDRLTVTWKDRPSLLSSLLTVLLIDGGRASLRIRFF